MVILALYQKIRITLLSLKETSIISNTTLPMPTMEVGLIMYKSSHLLQKAQQLILTKISITCTLSNNLRMDPINNSKMVS